MTLQEIKDYVKTLKGTSVPQRPLEYIEHLLSELESSQAHAADCESLKKENEVLREQNLAAVEEVSSLIRECDKSTNDAGNYAAKCVLYQQKIEQLEARHVQLIDEANKSMLQAHDYMNKCLNLEAVRTAAQNYVDTFACRLTLTSSITVPEKIDGKFTGDVKVKKLSETDFDGLSELKQALEEAK